MYFSKDENLSGMILKIGQSHRCRFMVSKNNTKSLQIFSTSFDTKVLVKGNVFDFVKS